MLKRVTLAAVLLAGPALAAPPLVERISPEAVLVRWDEPGPVDVLVADRPDAAPADARLVSKADADGRHEMTLPATPRAYILLRERDGGVERTAERLVALEHGSNFRDLGGYEAADGKQVRWGRIYRSGATPLLTDADVEAVRKLGVVQMIDLRSSEERVLAPSRVTGVPYTAIGYSMTEMMPTDPGALGAPGGIERLYEALPTFLAPHLKLVFKGLLSDQGPIVYNCSAGQDRTGFVSAMILSGLGVPRETIIADYHLSTALRRPEYEMPKIELAAHPNDPVAAMFAHGQAAAPSGRKPRPLKSADGRAYLEASFAAIEARWGSVEKYLEAEAGVGRAELTRLRQTYLE